MNKYIFYIQNVFAFLNKNWKELSYSLIITLVFFGAFSRMNYTTDTYADIAGSFSDISGNFLGAGRFFACALYVLYKIGINIYIVYSISFILAILAIALSIFVLGRYICVYISKKKKLLPYILATVLVINPFTIQLLFYFEKGVMASAILFAILGAITLHQYTKQKTKSKLLISFIFTLLSCCSYQGIVGLYIILSTLFILLDKNTNTKIIKKLSPCILIYLSAIVINLLLSKLINGSTKGGVSNINFLATLGALGKGIGKMLSLYNIVPAIIIYSLLVLVFISYLRKKKQEKSFFIDLVLLAILIVSVAILPYMSQSPDSIWFVPRSSWPFAAGVATLIIFICGQVDAKRKTLNMATFSCCLILLLELFSFNQIIIDHYQMNAIDKETIVQIGERITEFEDANNTKITNVAVVRDSNISYVYPNQKSVGDAQVMAMATNWSDVNAINYYTDRDMRSIQVDEKNEFCKDSDKLSLDIVFIEQDTLVICKH